MPKAFPLEFRRDVVAVARKGEAPLSQITQRPQSVFELAVIGLDQIVGVPLDVMPRPRD